MERSDVVELNSLSQYERSYIHLTKPSPLETALPRNTHPLIQELPSRLVVPLVPKSSVKPPVDQTMGTFSISSRGPNPTFIKG